MDAVPGRIGPLLTTGVALSVAAVVVANPVMAPRPDVQVPAVKLSGTGDAMDMLNKDFLSAIGPQVVDSSSNPFAVLKDLVSSLAADVTYLGRNVIVSAFFAGATAVTRPELTAASYPFLPPANAPVVDGTAVWSPSATPPAATGPVSAEELLAVAAIPPDLVPTAVDVVMSLMNDVGDLGEDAVSVAFAAGALLVAEGGHLLDVLTDIPTVLSRAVAGVASGGVQQSIADVIRGIIEPSPVTLPLPAPSVATPPADSSPPADGTPAGSGLPASPLVNETPRSRTVPRLAPRQVAVTPPAPESAPAAVEAPEALAPEALAIEPSDAAAKPAKAAVLPRVPAPSGPLADAVAQARQHAQGALQKAADGVRKAVDNVAKAASGPAGR